MRPPASLTTATAAFAARAMRTVLRLAAVLRRIRSRLRRLMWPAGAPFPPSVICPDYPGWAEAPPVAVGGGLSPAPDIRLAGRESGMSFHILAVGRPGAGE